MLGWILAVVLALIAWTFYDGTFSRSLPEKENAKVEAGAKILARTWVESKHLQHVPTSTKHLLVVSLTNNSDYILREIQLRVLFFDAANSRIGESYGHCLSEGKRDYRIRVGATLKQACVLPLSQQASTAIQGKSYDHFDWRFTKVAGHRRPIRFVKGLSDWWSSVSDWWSSMLETVNE